MINSTPDLANKAMIMMLFDGGMRIEEFLNLRIKDITLQEYRDNKVFWSDIRYSKTFARKIPLPLCNVELRDWLDKHPDKSNREALLFPFSYPAVAKRLRTLARKSIGKHVYPHKFRHSSATYWASRMNRQQLCVKFGWSFSSRMPDKYIKRKGIIFDHIAEQGDLDQTSRLKRDNMDMREELQELRYQNKRVTQALEIIMPFVMKELQGGKNKVAPKGVGEFQMNNVDKLLSGMI